MDWSHTPFNRLFLFKKLPQKISLIKQKVKCAFVLTICMIDYYYKSLIFVAQNSNTQ